MSYAENAQIAIPCAACKLQRRKCSEKCFLAPYFPPEDPNKFAIVHSVFGTSNLIKLLKNLPTEQRADAVNGIVYESNARVVDPVFGCAGVVYQLQQQISQLQSQLATAEEQIVNMSMQQSTHLSAFDDKVGPNDSVGESSEHLLSTDNISQGNDDVEEYLISDDFDVLSLLEPL
eukprot:Gb_09463 [translate_table: standard]